MDWRWNEHTLRREDGSIAKFALEWNPSGKRKRGRPTQSWRTTRMKGLKGKTSRGRNARKNGRTR